ncbi:MAG: hypothetical protein FWB97_01350 [Oscillospiraceae bacterium]|nr:hypothetical protein [Oscillospiraceae bacterium]
MQCKKWELWLAKVKYEDDPNTVKIRPVLIVAPQEVLVIAFKMTGTERIQDYKVKDWQGAGLDKETFIRVSLRLALQEHDLSSKIGMLQPNDIVGFQKHLAQSR